MQDYDGTPLSLAEYTQKLISQFFHEQGLKKTLASLEEETGRTFEYHIDTESGLAGALMNLVQIHLDDAHKIQKTAKGVLPEQLKTVGDGQYCSSLCHSIDELLGNANLIVVKCSPSKDFPLIAVGSSNRTLSIIDFSGSIGDKKKDEVISSTILRQYTFDGALLSIDWNKNTDLIVCSTMSAKHYLIDWQTDVPLKEFHDHMKYVVSVRFNEEGTLFASGSHDYTVKIYGLQDKSKRDDFVLLHSFDFVNCVESVIFYNDNVLAAVLEDNYIHSLNTKDYSEEKLNLNASGDDHVSFSVFDLSLCPTNNNLLLVATDRDKLVLFDLKTQTVLRNYFGAENDLYSHPSCCWSPNGQYVYATSQCGAICVWDLSTQLMVAKARAHSKQVRGIDYSEHHRTLVSVGYDAKIAFWCEDKKEKENEENENEKDEKKENSV